MMASTGVNVANITQVKVGKIPTQAVGLQGEEGRSLLFSETTAQFGCYVVSIASGRIRHSRIFTPKIALCTYLRLR